MSNNSTIRHTFVANPGRIPAYINIANLDVGASHEVSIAYARSGDRIKRYFEKEYVIPNVEVVCIDLFLQGICLFHDDSIIMDSTSKFLEINISDAEGVLLFSTKGDVYNITYPDQNPLDNDKQDMIVSHQVAIKSILDNISLSIKNNLPVSFKMDKLEITNTEIKIEGLEYTNYKQE